MLRIHVEEEYGYRQFIWEYLGTEEELIRWFCSLKDNPCGECFCFWNPSQAISGLGMGEIWEFADMPDELFDQMTESDLDFDSNVRAETIDQIEYYIHMHMAYDTYLEIKPKDICFAYDEEAMDRFANLVPDEQMA